MSGTLPYMAPELLRAEHADARADIWAAGAVLYEMATGKRAFPDKQPSMLIDAILHYDPVRPTLINPKITVPFEARDSEGAGSRSRAALPVGARVACRPATPAGRRRDRHRHACDQSKVREMATRGGANGNSCLAWRECCWLGLAIGYFVKRWCLHKGHQKILAVLPIETVGQDAATNALGLGLTETLTAKLVQASDSDSVQVVSPRDLRDQKVQTAGRCPPRVRHRLVLESSLQRSGQLIRINCYLVDSRTHRQIAARTIEADASDTFRSRTRW